MTLPGNHFRLDDLNEFHIVRIVALFRSVHRESPSATWPEVEFMERVGEALGSPPVLQVIGIGPGLEDLGYGSMYDPRVYNFAVRSGYQNVA